MLVILNRQLFLKDLKKLKKQPIYKKIVELDFETIPNIEELQQLSNVTASIKLF